MTTVVMTLPSRATTNNTDTTNNSVDGDDGTGGSSEQTGIVELVVSNGQEHVGGSSEETEGSGCDSGSSIKNRMVKAERSFSMHVWTELV